MTSMIVAIAAVTGEIDAAGRALLDIQAAAVDLAAEGKDTAKITTAVRGLASLMTAYGLIRPVVKPVADEFEEFLDSLRDADTGSA